MSIINQWNESLKMSLKVGEPVFVDNADSPMPSTSREAQYMRQERVGDLGLIVEIKDSRIGVQFSDKKGMILLFMPSELQYAGSRFADEKPIEIAFSDENLEQIKNAERFG